MAVIKLDPPEPQPPWGLGEIEVLSDLARGPVACWHKGHDPGALNSCVKDLHSCGFFFSRAFFLP